MINPSVQGDCGMYNSQRREHAIGDCVMAVVELLAPKKDRVKFQFTPNFWIL